MLSKYIDVFYGNGDSVKEAFFNGEKLEKFCLSVRQMMMGGELKFIKQ